MKPKFGKPLKHFTIRVTDDQLNFLQGLSNASEWLRHAIDSKMFEETTDVLAIVRRIEYLERKKSQIYDSKEYKLAKETVDCRFGFDYWERIEKDPSLEGLFKGVPFSVHYDNFSSEDRKLECKIYGLYPTLYFFAARDLITESDLRDFMTKSNLEIGHPTGYGRDIALKFFDMLKKKIAYMQKVYEKYTLKVAEIQNEIDSLKQKLIKEA